MVKFIPKDKLSKKAQKELNRQRRVTWDFSPVTKTVDSRKIYSRKRKAQNRDDFYGLSFFSALRKGIPIRNTGHKRSETECYGEGGAEAFAAVNRYLSLMGFHD